MFENKDKITFNEFQAWLTGLIRGKGGSLPDVDDWKAIKSMMDKVATGYVPPPVPQKVEQKVWPVIDPYPNTTPTWPHPNTTPMYSYPNTTPYQSPQTWLTTTTFDDPTDWTIVSVPETPTLLADLVRAAVDESMS